LLKTFSALNCLEYSLEADTMNPLLELARRLIFF